MIGKFLAHVRGLWADRSGNVALITALAALPVFGMLGFGIDYGLALSQKIKLDAATDAAALSAIATARNVIEDGGTTQDAINAGVAQARKYFVANAGTLAFSAVPDPDLQLVRNGQTLTATVAYSTSTTTNFSKIIGIEAIPLIGSATTTLSMKTFIDYYIIVDISQSMGIASTAKDMDALYKRVSSNNNGSGGETGCVFGCHVAAPANSGGLQKWTNEQLAHDTRFGSVIPLRIDAAIGAIKSIIAQAKTSSGVNGPVRIGIYTMSDDPITYSKLNTVSAPTSDFDSLSTKADTIQLGNNNSGGQGDSNFDSSLSLFNSNNLTASGDGSSPSESKKYVFIITDGAQDICGSSHCMKAFDPSASQCSNMKKKATVGVIYTTYLTIYKNNDAAAGVLEPNYARLVKPISPQIAPNLLKCSTSSDFYYEAVDGPAIAAGMQKLFASTASQARVSR